MPYFYGSDRIAPQASGITKCSVRDTVAYTHNQGDITMETSQDSRNMAVLMYILSIFFWIIPSLIMFLVKKDDAFVYKSSVEVLNFGITLTLAYFVLMFIPIIGWVLIPILALAALVLFIIGTLKVQKGEFYNFPVALRLIKAE
jgi:uncharacterized protein